MSYALASADCHVTPHSRRHSDPCPRARSAPTSSKRHTHQPFSASDHMRGWVRFGLSLPLPTDASAEMRAGYAEARNNTISLLTAQEHAA